MPKKSKNSLVSELMARKASTDKKIRSRSRSCLLCQKRKQKCDHRLPSCTTCIKAGVQCIQPEKYSVESPAKDEYTIILERRIRYLESFIDDSGSCKPDSFKKYKKLTPFIQQHETDASTIQHDDSIFESKYDAKSETSPELSSAPPASSGSEPVSLATPLTRSNAFDPNYNAEDAPDTPNVNSNSTNNASDEDIAAALEIPTFSLMNDPMRQLPKLGINGKSFQLPVSNASRSGHDSKMPELSESFKSKNYNNSTNNEHLSIAGPIDLSKTILGKYDMKEFINYDPEYEVKENLSRILIDTHFIRFQLKFPFLDEKEVIDFYHAYTKNNLSGYMNDINYVHFACCRMWLIFSLNSFILKTTGEFKRLEPLRLFSTALRHLARCKITDPYRQIEIYLLTILCMIRCDRDSIELYRIIGDAMRVTTSLELHKYSSYLNCSDDDRKKKMKCFWCVYLLDRLISVSIGKPFSVPEKEIDSDIPLFEDDPSKTNFVKDFNDDTTEIGKSKKEKILFINQCIKLKRIEAKAIESLNIVGSSTEYSTISELPLVEHYFDQLQNWRTECSAITKEVEKATLGLYYFRTVRVLIQPYLELMQPEDKLLKECQAAAGQICQLFKVFHQKTVYGHSTLAINNVFVAGVTLIYCLWLIRNTEDKRRKMLGDTAKHTRPVMTASLFTSLDDLKACSICLFVMAERSKYAIVFRDTFDQLLRATIGNLIERCGPDSSEIVYNHSLAKNFKQQNSLSDRTNYYQNGRPSIGFNKLSSNSVVTASGQSNSGVEFNNPDVSMPPAVVRKPVAHYDVIPDYFKNNHGDEYKQKQKEHKRKRGVLEKSAVPKSLSHLLISNTDSENSSEDDKEIKDVEYSKPSDKNNLTANSVNSNLSTPTATVSVNGNSGNNGISNGQFYGDLFQVNFSNSSTTPRTTLSNSSTLTNGSVNNSSSNNNNNNNNNNNSNSNGLSMHPMQSPKFFTSQSLFNPSRNRMVSSNTSNMLSSNPINSISNINELRNVGNGMTGNNIVNSNNNNSNNNNNNNNNGGLFTQDSQIPFTDRANDMINNISTWTEESGPITASYAVNNFIPYDFLEKDLAGQAMANQVYADLDTINNMNANKSPENYAANGTHPVTGVSGGSEERQPLKKRKFDTKNLFNGKFNKEIASAGSLFSIKTSNGVSNANTNGTVNNNSENNSNQNNSGVKPDPDNANKVGYDGVIGWSSTGQNEDFWPNGTNSYFMS